MPGQSFFPSNILNLLFPVIVFSTFTFGKSVSQNPSTMTFNDNWFIYPEEKMEAGGEVISSKEYVTDGWYGTDIPKTVFAALVENGEYKDPYFGMNLDIISSEPFEKPWWYRKEFTIDDLNEGENYRLTLEGINYKAELWINGKKIAGEDEIEGAYGIFKFDVGEYLQKGANVIAIRVIPPKEGDLTIGFVDWNPTPPDKMMGLWRGVELKKTGDVSIDDIFVQTKLNESYTKAEIIISGELKNYSGKQVKGTVSGELGGGIKFLKSFTIGGGESRKIVITPEDEPALLVENPKLWYPNNLGEPYLYNLAVNVNSAGTLSDEQSVRFGIREVDDYVNESGYRGYKVNGKKILIKGAGWVDDMMLNDSDEKVRVQVEYAKHMNLNTIRLEGFWGKNKTLYDAADENGLLIMVGWSCQWEWNNYCGREEDKYMCIRTPEDIELHTRQFNEQVKWLRNHPSVLVWVTGSDKYPRPEVQEKLSEYLKESDPTRPVLISCQDIKVTEEENRNGVYEDSGVKMYGPYDYEPPVYWYADTSYGGAYGFNTETGPGPQVPPLESLKRMLPEENLWPIDSVWNYHCGRHAFNDLNRYLEAFNNRYGEAESVEEFAMKSQMSNYEAMRPMFEAFEVNKFNATGVVQWMFNSAWPEMYWQLFDHYLMPNGSFYGAMKGCQPLSLVYNYENKKIYLVNDYNESVKNLSAIIKVIDANSNVLFELDMKVSIDENMSKEILALPEIEPETNLYFISLELKDSFNNPVSDNFYWFSKVEDAIDFENSEWYYSPIETFADLKEINNLPKAEISYTENLTEENGECVIEVVLSNESDKLAFFNELKIANEETGESVLPVFWSDNYVSLLPGAAKKITGRFKKTDKETKIKLIVSGWNAAVN